MEWVDLLLMSRSGSGSYSTGILAEDAGNGYIVDVPRYNALFDV